MYGHGLWAMEMGYAHGLWTWAMDMGHGHGLWTWAMVAMDIVVGVLGEPLGALLVPEALAASLAVQQPGYVHTTAGPAQDWGAVG